MSEKDILKRGWDAIESMIVSGPLSGNGSDMTAQRNGLILAANLIMELMERCDLEQVKEPRFRLGTHVKVNYFDRRMALSAWVVAVPSRHCDSYIVRNKNGNEFYIAEADLELP